MQHAHLRDPETTADSHLKQNIEEGANMKAEHEEGLNMKEEWWATLDSNQ